jgi:hypothetical protein
MDVQGLPLVAWRRIVASLDTNFDPAQLDAAQSACAELPDALRLAPGRWLRALLERGAEPRLRICRAVDLTLYDVDLPGDRFAWTDAPELAQVTVLRVFDERLDDQAIERWLRCSNNSQVTELALAGGITDPGARRLAGDDRLTKLRSLALFRSKIGPEGISAIISSKLLGGGLRRLLLGRNQLGEAGVSAIAGDTKIADLELLDLDCNRLDGPAIEALTRAPLLAGVRTLNLSNNPIGAEGCAALADCAYLSSLEQLFLHGCQLDDDAVEILLSAPFMARLRNLALSENQLSIATVERIAAARELRLRELDICHNHFVESEAQATLQATPMFAGLHRLCL